MKSIPLHPKNDKFYLFKEQESNVINVHVISKDTPPIHGKTFIYCLPTIAIALG